jgi:uncharacterized heparinase superfamily protein
LLPGGQTDPIQSGTTTTATDGVQTTILNASNNGYQRHHIATDKNFAGGYTPQFQAIFDKAGLSMRDKANQMLVSKVFHNGKHPNAYHEMVLRTLRQATQDKSGDAARQALVKALEKLSKQIEASPSILKKDNSAK